MLPGGRPAKMQFFGQSHEIPQLAQLHSRHPLPVSSLLPPPGLRHAQAVSGGFKVISSADGPCSSCLFPAWQAWDSLKVPQPRSYPAFSARRGELALFSGYPLAAGPPPISPNGSAPRCGHLDGLAVAAPISGGCRDCLPRQIRLASLRPARQRSLRRDRPPGRPRPGHGIALEVVLRPPVPRLTSATA